MNKKSIGHVKAIIALARKIAKIIWYFITNDKRYGDEKGSENGEIRKKIIVRVKKFLANERITIIDEIIAIMTK